MVSSNKEKFVVRRDTMAILPESTSSGNYSKVIEGNHNFCVDLSPYQLMNESLLHYCSDLKGAIRGTKTILGNIHIPPVRINGNPDMYWIPHISPKQADCVWIALHHIADIAYYSKKHTRVMLSNGCMINLEISIKQLQSRIDSAEQLQYKMKKITDRTGTFMLDPEYGMEFIRDEYNNYRNKHLKQIF
ncbi:competence protein ComK [Cytobacillus oceanisediminis]|jgi:competence protein ComK|uniref:Competence protein ComK n=1 Tax=Cytobacillus oceanisediminis TaxID=665099 RepID=A0A2V3A4E2_9BACI|nr:competence protein ComK [Cytobacillus oceanisediminis]PWW28414.1 competence protein ComK [Cytobacillus oceanisediminis]